MEPESGERGLVAAEGRGELRRKRPGGWGRWGPKGVGEVRKYD